jgi:hypothetical protein
MANQKNKKAAAGETANLKKGQVTIDGINFNDEWARNLEAREANQETGTPAMSPEEIFIAEYEKGHYQDKKPEIRRQKLQEAFKACLSAED